MRGPAPTPSIARRGGGFGPNLVTNGTFTTDTSGWTAGNSGVLSVASGRLRVTNGAAAAGTGSQAITVLTGATYEVVFDFFAGTGSASFRVGNAVGGTQYVNESTAGSSTGVTRRFVPTQTSITITCRNASTTSGHTADFDNITLRRVL